MSQGSRLSLQDRLRQDLKPLGGTLRIDAFFSLMARERARKAAEEKAAEEAARQAEIARVQQERAKEPPTAAQPDKGEEDIQSFLRRDERSQANADEVSDFMDFLGSSGFDPEAMGS